MPYNTEQMQQGMETLAPDLAAHVGQYKTEVVVTRIKYVERKKLALRDVAPKRDDAPPFSSCLYTANFPSRFVSI